jgi:hypothetical protein
MCALFMTDHYNRCHRDAAKGLWGLCFERIAVKPLRPTSDKALAITILSSVYVVLDGYYVTRGSLFL